MRASREERDRLHALINHQIRDLFHIEDMTGIDVFSSLVRISQLLDLLDTLKFQEQPLSSPRWRLLLRLFIAERMGNSGGLTPTDLSHSQRVSKNTISTLLRGLEEQGFIVREIDQSDLRIFRIHLTDAGRDLIHSTAPQRIAGLNTMLAGMQPDETKQLSALLEKLRHSLEDQLAAIQKDQAVR